MVSQNVLQIRFILQTIQIEAYDMSGLAYVWTEYEINCKILVAEKGLLQTWAVSATYS